MKRVRTTGFVLVALAVALAVGMMQMGTIRERGREVQLAAAPIASGDLLDRSRLLLPNREAPRLSPAPQALAVPAAPPPRAPRPPRSAEKAIAPAPERFVGQPAPAAPPPPALRQPTQGTPAKGGTWAVIIGINNYPGTSHDLRSAVNDANDVNEMLWRLGVPGDHRLLIRDGQATGNVIRSSMDWLVSHAGPDSTAVFFYAGHVRKLGNSTEGMVGADGNVVRDTELAARLSGLRASRTWLAIAGCYGGGFTEALGTGRILTGASPANELAYENEGFKRSYMVQYMVREALIEGRAGATTVEAAFTYARQALARDYPNRQPVQYDNFNGVLELRPAGAPAPNHAAPPGGRPPAQQPPPQQEPPDPGQSKGGGSSEPPQDGCTWSMGLARCEKGDPKEGGA